MDTQTWYTVEEAAGRWRLSAEAVRRMIRRGELTVLDMGGRRGYRISEEEVQRYEGERVRQRTDIQRERVSGDTNAAGDHASGYLGRER